MPAAKLTDALRDLLACLQVLHAPAAACPAFRPEPARAARHGAARADGAGRRRDHRRDRGACAGDRLWPRNTAASGRRWRSPCSLIVTGALHEDGLADVADGFGGGATVAQKLDIMRDSRLGAYRRGGARALAYPAHRRAGRARRPRSWRGGRRADPGGRGLTRLRAGAACAAAAGARRRARRDRGEAARRRRRGGGRGGAHNRRASRRSSSSASATRSSASPWRSAPRSR